MTYAMAAESGSERDVGNRNRGTSVTTNNHAMGSKLRHTSAPGPPGPPDTTIPLALPVEAMTDAELSVKHAPNVRMDKNLRECYVGWWNSRDAMRCDG